IAGGNRIELADGADIALWNPRYFLDLRAVERKERARTLLRSVAQCERVAIVQRAAEIARVSELARLPRVRDRRHESAGAGEAQARSGRLRLGSVVTQRLKQPAHAVALGGRAEEYRRDQSIA